MAGAQASLPMADGQPVLEDLARAKVNLTLRVLGRRPDGYHELDSIVAFADDGDIVRFFPGAPVSVRVTGRFSAKLPGDTIVTSALARLQATEPRLRLGAVEIEKRLPVAAGLGGGSADAAAVLRLVRIANPDFSESVDWSALALTLGSDVPVCFASEACRMQGRGDVLSRLPFAIQVPAVLANDGGEVAIDKTAQIFRALAAGPVGDVSAAPLQHFAQGRNDLEPAALRVMPSTGSVLQRLGELPGARWARMSGAGPTCFAVFDTEGAARAAAQLLRAQEPAWWVEPVLLS